MKHPVRSKENTRFTFFRGAPVLILDRLQDRAFCVGLIVMGRKEYHRCRRGQAPTLEHEYGHLLQLLILGLPVYVLLFLLPSVTCYWTHCCDFCYYALPWEYTADRLGGAKRRTHAHSFLCWLYFGAAAVLTWLLRLVIILH